jgi:hypothetical protein
MERLGDQLLAHLGPIRVGGVDQIDSELDGASQHRDRLIVILRWPPDARPSDAHRAEAQPANAAVADLQSAGRDVGELWGLDARHGIEASR